MRRTVLNSQGRGFGNPGTRGKSDTILGASFGKQGPLEGRCLGGGKENVRVEGTTRVSCPDGSGTEREGYSWEGTWEGLQGSGRKRLTTRARPWNSKNKAGKKPSRIQGIGGAGRFAKRMVARIYYNNSSVGPTKNKRNPDKEVSTRDGKEKRRGLLRFQLLRVSLWGKVVKFQICEGKKPEQGYGDSLWVRHSLGGVYVGKRKEGRRGMCVMEKGLVRVRQKFCKRIRKRSVSGPLRASHLLRGWG